jgi:hypothetical protein
MITIKQSRALDGRFVLDIGEYIFHINRQELKRIYRDAKNLLKRRKK